MPQEASAHSDGNCEATTVFIFLTALKLILCTIKSPLHFIILFLLQLSTLILSSTSSTHVTSVNDLSSWIAISILLRPLFKLHIGTFSIQTLGWFRQQELAKTRKLHIISVCYLSKARIQDLTLCNQCRDLVRNTLRVSGNVIAASYDLPSVRIALSLKTEQAVPDWILVDNYLYASHLNGVVRELLRRFCPFSQWLQLGWSKRWVLQEVWESLFGL